MGSTFNTYLQLGFHHILDFQGYDHILFVIALCAAFEVKYWKQLLILITAFTVGHSITLALAALDLVKVDAALVELLIAITIGVTALQNIFLPKPDKTGLRLKYAMALFFGLIHGLGFSGYFRALLGKASDIVWPLFSFNVGIELGQLIIVAVLFLAFVILQKGFKAKPRDWNLFLSGMAFGVSCVMILDRM